MSRARHSGEGFRRRVRSLPALALCSLAALALLGAASPSAAAPGDGDNVVVVRDDGSILEAARPLPLAGSRVRFVPLGGGYTTLVEPLPPIASATWSRGRKLEFRGETPEPVRPGAPFPFYGTAHDEIFVHPHGAVSLGRPLPPSSRAEASAPGGLVRALVAGPPVIAGLWNELLAARSGAGSVFVDEQADRTSVSWIGVPSARPAGEPNDFRITLYRDGRVDLEYGVMSTTWGVVGLSPGHAAERTQAIDLARPVRGAAGAALLAWYHDLPALDEIALARAVYRQVADRFQFLSVFTTQPVESSSLVGSIAVKNLDRGIGVPLLDRGDVFGTRNLEHVVLMNDLDFWDDDPTRRPRHPAYAFAPSTLAVLAHEAGHRWLAEASCPAGPLASADGHWSFFLDSGGSLLGGNLIRDNADGSFTTEGALRKFGPLDQYLMGVRPPGDVPPFFLVENPDGFDPPRSTSGQPFGDRSRPEPGVTFRGTRRGISIDDVIRESGERQPAVGVAPTSFRMAFVLVVPAGSEPTAAELEKIERVRRGIGPFFQIATDSYARMGTALLPGVQAASPADDPVLSAGEPRVLSIDVRPRGGDRFAVKIEFADTGADLAAVEIAPDASRGSPTTVDATTSAWGARTGTISFGVQGIDAAARALRFALVDQRGQRSAVSVRPLPGRS